MVTIKLKDGKEYSTKWETWRGYHKSPMTTEELVAKYKDGISEVLSPAQADHSIELVLGLDKVKDVSELMKILTYPR